MTWLERNAPAGARSRRAVAAPEPGAGRPPALRPEAADEGRHEPGPERLWNESWYFDAISDAGDLGLYVRLGRLPNQGVRCTRPASAGPAARR